MDRITTQTKFKDRLCISFRNDKDSKGKYVKIIKGDGCRVDVIGKLVKEGETQNLFLHSQCMNLKTVMHLLVHLLGT